MPYKDIKERRAANRAAYAKRVKIDPEYSKRRAAKQYENNPESGRIRQARYRAKHPTTDENRAVKKEYNARYYAEHGEIMRANQRVRNANAYATNPEKSQTATKRWAANHPEKGAERQARRRARQASAGVCEVVDRLVVAERDGWICQLCFEPIDQNATYRDESGKGNPGYLNVDHKYPLAKGGDHSYANSQAAHSVCNKRKSARID